MKGFLPEHNQRQPSSRLWVSIWPTEFPQSPLFCWDLKGGRLGSVSQVYPASSAGDLKATPRGLKKGQLSPLQYSAPPPPTGPGTAAICCAGACGRRRVSWRRYPSPCAATGTAPPTAAPPDSCAPRGSSRCTMHRASHPITESAPPPPHWASDLITATHSLANASAPSCTLSHTPPNHKQGAHTRTQTHPHAHSRSRASPHWCVLRGRRVRHAPRRCSGWDSREVAPHQCLRRGHLHQA